MARLLRRISWGTTLQCCRLAQASLSGLDQLDTHFRPPAALTPTFQPINCSRTSPVERIPFPGWFTREARTQAFTSTVPVKVLPLQPETLVPLYRRAIPATLFRSPPR